MIAILAMRDEDEKEKACFSVKFKRAYAKKAER